MRLVAPRIRHEALPSLHPADCAGRRDGLSGAGRRPNVRWQPTVGPWRGGALRASAADHVVKPNRPAPWENPLGVFYLSKRVPMLAELGAAARVMGHQSRWESEAGPRTFDDAVAGGDGTDGVIVTLMAQTEGREMPGDEAVGYHKYCLPEGRELVRSLWFVQRAVERYDGDEDFGCMTAAGPDCHGPGDGLYPVSPRVLRSRPIHRWQVENEFFYQMVDCASDDEGAPLSPDKAVAYLTAVAGVIRAADPHATVIFPAITGLRPVLFERGLVTALDAAGQPVRAAAEVVAADAVPLADLPVLVEASP